MGMLQYLRLTPCRVEYTLFLFLHKYNKITVSEPHICHSQQFAQLLLQEHS